MNIEFKSDDQINAHDRENLEGGININHTGTDFKKGISDMSLEITKNVGSEDVC